MKGFRRAAVFSLALGLAMVIGLVIGGRASAAGDALIGCDDELGCVRFLWPADPAAPAKLIELTADWLESGRSDTALGKLVYDRFALTDPSGDEVAETVRYTLELSGGHHGYIFETTLEQPITGPTGSFGKPLFALPALTPPPSHRRKLAFKEDAFAPPTKKPTAATGPAMAYSDGLETVIVSPLSHFLVSIYSFNGDEISMGIEGLAERVPAGETFSVMALSGQGVNESFRVYGDAIREWLSHDRIDPYRDVAVGLLGYWTDNGAYYYYKTAPGMNYHDTLVATMDDARKRGVPYGYLQIDSWWYPKARSNSLWGAFRGGSLAWEPIPEYFPEGLMAFRDDLGVPLVAHNRWYSDESPYCRRYECVYGGGDKRPALPIDAAFWDEIMDNAVSYGVEVYEQDWLITQMNAIPWLREGLHNAERWFDTMAEKARDRGLTMQLCMASPGFFLEQMKFDHVTHVRCSGDYLAGAPKTIFWPAFHQTSMLAHAMGTWPFKDNFLSSSFQRGLRNEPWPLEEALISNLSAGPVGPADKIGKVDAELVNKTCRRDGVLLKPDRPATPIDLMFLPTAKPWIVTTESGHELGQTTYLAAFNLWPHRMLEPRVSLKELGLKGDYVVYNWRKPRLARGADGVDFGLMPLNRAEYFILAPVVAGVAVIGELDKFVTMSAKRFPTVAVVGGRLELEVEGDPGEEVRVLIWKDRPPTRVVGASGPERFEAGMEGAFTVTVTIPASGSTSIAVD